MREYLNKILIRLRTEHPARRIAFCAVTALALLICARLGVVEALYGHADQPAPVETVPGDYLNDKDDGLRFAGETLDMPGGDVTLRDAVLVGGGIYMLGSDASMRPCLFLMDTQTREITRVSVAVTGTVVGIGSGPDGSRATLSATTRGRYYITVTTPDGLSTETRLYRDTDSVTPLESALIYGGGFLAAAGDEVLAFDSAGSCVRTYGPYSGALQLLLDGEGRAVIVSRGYGDARTTVEVIGGDLGVAESYVLTAGYTEFYPGEGSGLFAATARTILRVDYVSGTGTEYADLLLSGGGRSGFIYLSETSFFSREDGLPTVWRPYREEDLSK